MNFKEFKKKCYSFCNKSKVHNKKYVDESLVRFFNTWKFVHKLKMEGGGEVKVLSLGAGGAYVEAVLQSSGKYECTIVDFPTTIERNKDYYDSLGFKIIGADVSDDNVDWTSLIKEKYDLVLSLENIEHIPQAPSRYIKRFMPFLRKDGYFVVSTLNLASINRIFHQLLMIPFFDIPEKFFGPVCPENEGCHRREYMACEMEDEMKRAGLKDLQLFYTNKFIKLL